MTHQMLDADNIISQTNETGVADKAEVSKFNKRYFIAGALVLLLAGAAGAYYFGIGGANEQSDYNSSTLPSASVVVANATAMTMAPHTVLPGTVLSMNDSVIASETTGKVLSVALVGDIVKHGDTLAEIDSQNAKQIVSQREAAVARLQSLYQYHKDYFARVDLEENKLGIPEIGVAELRSNMETARADLQSAQAELTTARLNLSRTSIIAPFSGRVVSQSIQSGEYAQVGSPVVRLVDTDNLEISARVPASLVQPIAAGSMLQVNSGGKVFEAPLRTLVPVGDAISRTMELRVTLENSGLLVGSAVRVNLPSAQAKEVVAVPRDAVILRANAQYIFVVDEAGVANRRDIELGFAEGAMIEAIGKVSAGDTVIIRGGERLRDGQTVSWNES